MKPQIINYTGIQTPPDGLTDEEKILQRVLAEESILNLYDKLPTSRMKFIVAAHFELGYPQTLIAKMLDISQPRINKELENIRKVLENKPFRPYKRKGKVSIEKLLELCMMLRD